MPSSGDRGLPRRPPDYAAPRPAGLNRCVIALLAVGVTLVATFIALKLTVSLLHPSSNASTRTPALLFIVTQPFEGERVLTNDPASPYPYRATDGTFVIKIDPTHANYYDQSRTPTKFFQQAALLDGRSVTKYFATQSTDDHRNMTVRMWPLSSASQPATRPMPLGVTHR